MTLADELGKLEELHRRGALGPIEFQRAKERVIDGAAGTGARPNVLARSRRDRWLGGVCGGLAELTQVAAWIWRLFFVMLLLFAGTGLAAYVLLWAFVPAAAEPGTADNRG